MAAGAYKGLTIRIGADTTKLTSALRGVNSAAFKTEGELRKLAQAAKLDPGNGNVVKAQLGAMANEATDTAAKFDLLKRSIEETSNQQSKSGSGETIGMLAESTENAALAAQNAKDRYNNLTAEIEHVSDSIKELNGTDLSEAVRQSEGDYIKARDALLEWANAAENSAEVEEWERKNGESIYSAIENLETLRETWVEANNEFEDAKLVESLHNASVEAIAAEAKMKSFGAAMANINKSSNMSKAFEGMDKRLEIMNNAAETASDRFQRLDAAAKINPTSLGTAIDRAKALAEVTDIARQRAAQLQEKLNGYKALGIDQLAKGIDNSALNLEKMKSAYVEAENKVSELSGQLNNARKEYQEFVDVGGDGSFDTLDKMTGKLDDLEREFKEAERARDEALENFDTAKAVSEFNEVETELREVKAELKDVGKFDFSQVRTAAVNAANEIGQLMREAGQEVIKASIDVDSAYRDLRKTFDGTEEEYENLYDAAMKYSQSNVTSADTMLKMESIAAQLGVGLDEQGNKYSDAAEQIQHFAEVAANLDVATDIDADTIALQMGQIQNVMKDVRPDNIERFGDALVRLGNTMPAQESAIMQITQRLAAVGSTTSFTTPQIMGWAAAIAGTGQRSEAAATSISTTITTIQKAVGAGGDELELFAQTAGESAEEFAQHWREDPSEALKAFIVGLKRLDEDSLQVLEDLGINSVRATQTLLALAQTTDTVDGAIEKANQAWGDEAAGIASAGDAMAEAQKKAEGFSGTYQKLQNNIQVLAASFGDALVPYMNKGIEIISKLTDYINSLDDKTKSTIVLVSGLTAVFASVQPVIAALFGHFKNLVFGGISFATQSIANLVVGFKGLTSIMGSFIKAPVETAGALSGLGGSVGMLGKALAVIATPAGAAAAAIGLIAAAVGGVYLVKFIEAKKHADDFSAAMSGIKETTDGLHKDLLLGSEAVDKYAESWSAARADMDGLIKTIRENNDENLETRKSTSESIANMEHYRDIVLSAIEAEDKSTVSKGELGWALEHLNEITGEAWTVEDVLSGKYTDQDGAVRNLKNSLVDLIEQRKKEAQINALGSMLDNATENQMKAKEAYDEAGKAMTDYFKMRKESWEETQAFKDGLLSEKEILDKIYSDEEYKQRKQDWTEAMQLYKESGEEVDRLTNELDGLANEQAYMTSTAYGQREGIIQTTEAMREACEQYGINDEGIKSLAAGIEAAGVSTRQFAQLTGEDFASMVQQANGDISALVQLIADWAAQNPIEPEIDTTKAEEEAKSAAKNISNTDAEMNVEADTSEAEGQVESFIDDTNETTAEVTVTTKQETEQADTTQATQDQTATLHFEVDTSGIQEQVAAAVKDITATVTVIANSDAVQPLIDAINTVPKDTPVSITASTNGVDAATREVGELNSIASNMRSVKARYEAAGNAATSSTPATNIGKLNTAARSMSGKTVTYTANGNVANGSAAREVRNLISAIRDLSGKTITLTTIKRTVKEEVGNSATGAYVPLNKMPKHAAGIFTRPTLTNIGWVGEDGAELYSGNSLVPLTNRKYSMPYIDDISDAVAKKIGPVNSGNQITVTVTGVTGPDEVADAIVRKFALLGY